MRSVRTALRLYQPQHARGPRHLPFPPSALSRRVLRILVDATTATNTRLTPPVFALSTSIGSAPRAFVRISSSGRHVCLPASAAGVRLGDWRAETRGRAGVPCVRIPSGACPCHMCLSRYKRWMFLIGRSAAAPARRLGRFSARAVCHIPRREGSVRSACTRPIVAPCSLSHHQVRTMLSSCTSNRGPRFHFGWASGCAMQQYSLQEPSPLRLRCTTTRSITVSATV
jgi:hypothetical protein